MNFCMQMAAEVGPPPRLPSDPIVTMYSKLYDAYEAGYWEHLPAFAKSFFNALVDRIADLQCHGRLQVDLEDIGIVPLVFLLPDSSPDFHHQLTIVTYRLFLQMVAICSTPTVTGQESETLMTLELHCHTFAHAQDWLSSVSAPN